MRQPRQGLRIMKNQAFGHDMVVLDELSLFNTIIYTRTAAMRFEGLWRQEGSRVADRLTNVVIPDGSRPRPIPLLEVTNGYQQSVESRTPHCPY